MRRNEINVGGLYTTKVNGRTVTMRVDAIRERGFTKGGLQVAYDVTNLTTGRSTTFRSAAKFRGVAPAEGEKGADPIPNPAASAPSAMETPTATTSAQTTAPLLSTTAAPPLPECPSCEGEDARLDGDRYVLCGECGYRWYYRAPQPVAVSAPEIKLGVVGIVPDEAEELLRPEATADRLLLEERSVAEPDLFLERDDQEPSPEPAPVANPNGLAAKLRERKARPAVTVPHLLIEARAGTGKTTTLIEGLKRIKGVPSEHPAARDPMPQQLAIWEAMAAGSAPRTIAFVAFNKSIASELQSRVPEGCEASTMHSMGFKAINRAFSSLKVNNYNVQDIIARLLGRDIRDLRKESPVVLKATEELVGLCKVNLVGQKDVSREYGEAEGAACVGPEELSKLADYYDVDLSSDSGRSYRDEVFALVPRVLDACLDPMAQGAIDFNDMIWLPVVLDLPVFRYDLLLIDEFQDTNRCQQALAKKAGRRLVMCGDPFQSIYGFAGADARSMVRMEEELAATPAGCEHLYLTVTRRCGKAIVDEARQVCPDFEAHASNPSGKVSAAKYPLQGPRNERKEIPYEQTYMPGVADGDFILCRTNAPLVSQCFRFIKRGCKATIQGRDIGQGLISTVQKQKAGSVRELIEKLSRWYNDEEAKERAKRNPSEARLLALSDRYDCLMCFCGDLPSESPVTAVEAKINAIFTDDKNAKGVRLSSVHKAKGLEADRVFFLNIPEGPCPHPMAESDWEREQEDHIWYVGVTRAREELVWVR